MRQAHIFSIATALPVGKYRQEEASLAMSSRLGLKRSVAAKLERIYAQTAISTRYTVLEDPFGPDHDHFFSLERQPKMRERNDLYKQKALPLALEAASRSLEGWQGKREEITHVISVSCTGIFAPGLEFSLLQELGLSPKVERFGINFMGCFGAFRGLAAAAALALQNSKNRILLVCTELCSLHFQPTETWDALISNALFGDGAAAVIVGSEGNDPSFSIIRTSSLALPNSFEEMQWDAGDEGLFMKLTLRVPAHLRAKIQEFVSDLLQETATIQECDFPLHPGGKAILEQLEEELGLSKKQTEASWKVLAACGNLSSATFLFVLQELLQKSRPSRLPFAVGVGFGPGLAMEGILLQQ